jgi:hypothetical protein
MTKRQMESLVNKWCYALGVERWDVKIVWAVKPETYGVQAEINTNEQYDRAEVRFNEGWPLWDEARAEKTIIHELLHILHNRIDNAVEKITAEVPTAATSLAESWYTVALESYIDRMSLRLYEVTR